MMSRVVLAGALLAGVACAFVPARQVVLAAPRTRQAVAAPMSMKIFDWKRRESPEPAGVEDLEFRIGNMRPAPGAHKRKTRKGRGIAAGQGATCGFGMRGQKSRAGRPTRPGFEGGQTALYRRIPKLVGRPTGPGHKKEIFSLIPLAALNALDDNAETTFADLMEKKILTKGKQKIYKVVGDREASEFTTSGLTVKAHAFTTSAREAIEGKGGKCVTLSKTTGLPIEA